MWYKLSTEQKKIVIPGMAFPGDTPLKPGHYRAYHSVTRRPDKGTTGDEIIDSIKTKGLSLEHAKGHTYGEPDIIWGVTGDYPNAYENRYNKHVPAVEFQVSRDHLRGALTPSWSDSDQDYEKHFASPNQYVALMQSIEPENIIEVYPEWFDSAIYLLHNPDVWDYAIDHLDTMPPEKEGAAIRFLLSKGAIKHS